MKPISKRQKKQLLSLAIALVLIGISLLMQRNQPSQSIQKPSPDPGFVTVTKFEDGDTISVTINGTEEKVRLVGVDTPETKDPRKPVQCFGQAASEFTKQLIGSNTVRLETDSKSNDRDKYDRLLRYVYLPDGRLVNAEIIKQGYGFAYLSFPFDKEVEFTQYQTAAREQNKGLWAACSVTEQQNGNHTSN